MNEKKTIIKKRVIAKWIYIIVMMMVAVSALAFPWVIYSMYQEVNSNNSNSEVFNLVDSKAAGKIDISLTYDAIDPINLTSQVTVKGYKICTSQEQCESLGSELLVSSYSSEHEKSDDIVPSYVTIPLPASSGIYEEKFKLPVFGNIVTYPFDTWSSNISIGIVDAQGVVVEEPNNITLNIDENVSRLKNAGVQLVDKSMTNTKIPDLFATVAKFERPLYVKFITALMVVLLFFATLCTISFTNHANLIMGSAGITLGVWSARSLLLGDLPPDTTYIDMILVMLIILVLMSVAVKVAIHIKRGGKFRSS